MQSLLSITLAEGEQVIQHMSANGTRNLRPFTVRTTGRFARMPKDKYSAQQSILSMVIRKTPCRYFHLNRESNGTRYWFVLSNRRAVHSTYK